MGPAFDGVGGGVGGSLFRLSRMKAGVVDFNELTEYDVAISAEDEWMAAWGQCWGEASGTEAAGRGSRRPVICTEYARLCVSGDANSSISGLFQLGLLVMVGGD